MTPRGLAAGLLVVLSMVAVRATTLFGQSGGPYDLHWNTIDGGGTTSATGGIYALGGTIGQADAGRVAGGSVVVNGGFWKPVEALSPTATPTDTVTSTPTVALTPTTTATVAPTRTLPASATPTHPLPPSATASTTTATATATPKPCAGDCSGNKQVTVDEVLTMVNIALGNANVATCGSGDANHNGQITVDEIVTAVDHAINGCVVS